MEAWEIICVIYYIVTNFNKNIQEHVNSIIYVKLELFTRGEDNNVIHIPSKRLSTITGIGGILTFKDGKANCYFLNNIFYHKVKHGSATPKSHR